MSLCGQLCKGERHRIFQRDTPVAFRVLPHHMCKRYGSCIPKGSALLRVFSFLIRLRAFVHACHHHGSQWEFILLYVNSLSLWDTGRIGKKEKQAFSEEKACVKMREIHAYGWGGSGEKKKTWGKAFVYSNFNYTLPLMTPLACVRLVKERERGCRTLMICSSGCQLSRRRLKAHFLTVPSGLGLEATTQMGVHAKPHQARRRKAL